MREARGLEGIEMSSRETGEGLDVEGGALDWSAGRAVKPYLAVVFVIVIGKGVLMSWVLLK